ncbi:ATP-binding protein [Raoultibacter phocaeensis]|uniref:ATP-binding protein n=1 Tax=Raoultibacter phocaeensis TaxID=2479841 RepID=UPI00111B43CF|nr:ATP-binding protein [Raoultibacter phocaeensis]
MAGQKPTVSLKTKIIGLLTVVLLILLAVDILWTYESQKQATESVLLDEARVLVEEMNAVWEFISINQDTINYTSDGEYEYKGLHCAIAGKSVAAFFSKDNDYAIRFTNTVPRNFHNEPNDYELAALSAFSDGSGTEEYYGFDETEDGTVFRYVSAMKVTEHCTECHGKPEGEIDPTGYAKEGWETGDVAGAVSVVVPTETSFANMRTAIVTNVLFFLAAMLCMAVIIYFVLTRLITNPLESLRRSFAKMSDGTPSEPPESEGTLRPVYASRELDALFDQFNDMAQSLSSLYANLESEVDERTVQLSAANEELERQRAHVEKINDKLKRENQYKSDFLAIVSHELRTPLTSILAFTDLMADSVSSDNALAAKQLEEIDKNGRILLEMVDNVLETARIQAGSEKLNLELVDLNDVVGMVEASSESLALKKRIALTTRVAPDVPLIESDWEKVRRILVNLVSNAIKFTPEEGSVEVNVAYDESSATVTMDVADTGIGIPADKQELIFERFAQENMSTVRRYGGSGLGLSLVKDLAAMLEGSVSVESELGCGSTFRVVLPAKRHAEVHDD